MNGKEVKEKLISAGINFKSVSDAMGISQQSFFSLMRTKDVKTDVLQRVAEASGRSILWFLSDVSTDGDRVSNNEITKLHTIIEERDKTTEKQEKKIEDLIKKLALSELNIEGQSLDLPFRKASGA